MRSVTWTGQVLRGRNLQRAIDHNNAHFPNASSDAECCVWIPFHAISWIKRFNTTRVDPNHCLAMSGFYWINSLHCSESVASSMSFAQKFRIPYDIFGDPIRNVELGQRVAVMNLQDSLMLRPSELNYFGVKPFRHCCPVLTDGKFSQEFYSIEQLDWPERIRERLANFLHPAQILSKGAKHPLGKREIPLPLIEALAEADKDTNLWFDVDFLEEMKISWKEGSECIDVSEFNISTSKLFSPPSLTTGCAEVQDDTVLNKIVSLSSIESKDVARAAFFHDYIPLSLTETPISNLLLRQSAFEHSYSSPYWISEQAAGKYDVRPKSEEVNAVCIAVRDSLHNFINMDEFEEVPAEKFKAMMTAEKIARSERYKGITGKYQPRQDL